MIRVDDGAPDYAAADRIRQHLPQIGEVDVEAADPATILTWLEVLRTGRRPWDLTS